MKIAVIAASGKSGKIFVQQALDAGHTVRAGIHHSNHLAPRTGLNIIPCDATNIHDLAKLIEHQDVVVSLIGHVRHSPPHVQTEATAALINVMHNQKMKRLISLTGTGVRFPNDKIPLMDRLLNLAIQIIDPKRVSDGRNHVRLLQQSDLDWTVMRVLKLQNTAPKPFMLTLHGPTKWFVSRTEVAKAILQVLEEGSFIKNAPIISQQNPDGLG